MGGGSVTEDSSVTPIDDVVGEDAVVEVSRRFTLEREDLVTPVDDVVGEAEQRRGALAVRREDGLGLRDQLLGDLKGTQGRNT